MLIMLPTPNAINSKEQILELLNAEVKSRDEDPDQRWTPAWNNNLDRLKIFFMWLYDRKNEFHHTKESEWTTPSFMQVRNKKTKTISHYLESELWEKEDYSANMFFSLCQIGSMNILLTMNLVLGWYVF